MEIATIIALVKAVAILVGSIAALITAIQGLRKPKKRFEGESRLDKIMDRLSFVEQGKFRNGIPKAK